MIVINQSKYNYIKETITIKLVNINKQLSRPSNKNPMNDSFLKQSDNQFLINNKHVTSMKGRSQSVDAIINKLNQKNSLLKKEVTKIDRVLSSLPVQQKTRYGITLPEIKPDVIKKQLDNAYKQIKIYEHEISKKKEAESEVAFVEQCNKIQRIYKQKVQFHQKLKRQYQSVKQKSKQYIKMLKNDNLKNQYIQKQLKLNSDIKWLQEMMRQSDQKRTISIAKLEKQRRTIKQMEVQLLKQNSNEYLESIKFKIFHPNQNNGLTPTRSIFDIQNEHLNTVQNKGDQSRLEQYVQDKTPEAFQSLGSDVKLLKKMHSDYESKINLLNKQRDEAAQRNFRSRNRLLQIQFEIQTLQKNIAECKKLIDPKMLRPKLAQSLMAQSRMSQKKEIVKKGPSIPHQFKYIQTGEITKQGKRFSDQIALGKKNSKIVGMTLYEKQQTGQFVGIQATYQMSDHKKVANLNLLIDTKKTPVTQQQYSLDFGDYIKTIDLFVKKNIITGISMVSRKGKVIKAGDSSGERKILKMQQQEYPMCFYGSLLLNGFQCFGVQIFQVKKKQQ